MTRDEIIIDVANRVGTNPQWLDALINFETAGTYSPTIENKRDPQAKGLIQFRNAASQDLGYQDSLDLVTKNPTFESQMYNAVLPYFEMRKRKYGPLDTEQKLYMAVFNPGYINVPPDTVTSPEIQKGNPEIKTVQDYIDLVRRRINENYVKVTDKLNPMKALLLAGIIAGAAWMWLRKG